MNNPSLQSEIDSRCPCFAMSASECKCTIPQENVICPRCFHPHIDLDEWAIKPHKTHLCQHCGNLFEGTYKAVSNPSFTSGFLNAETVKAAPQKSEYEQMIQAIKVANYWLQRAYKLMENQGITDESVDSNWPINLGDAVHYCAETLSELDPE